MQKFIYYTGILVLYVLLNFVVSYMNVDFVCGFTWVCDAENTEQQVYLLTGQMIMFMNLWAAYFFVNVNFFRDGAIEGQHLIRPAITSTVLSTIVFVSAIYLMSISGFLIMALTGISL